MRSVFGSLNEMHGMGRPVAEGGSGAPHVAWHMLHGWACTDLQERVVLHILSLRR